ncbi:MAG: hypothetical protein QM713_02490 [Arachnia sp.]
MGVGLALSSTLSACVGEAPPPNPSSPPISQQGYLDKAEIERKVLLALKDQAKVVGVAYHQDPQKVVIAVLTADGEPSSTELDAIRATAEDIVGDIPIEFFYSAEKPTLMDGAGD